MNVDLTHRILDALGKPRSLIKPVADRPGHDRRYCLDTSQAAGPRMDTAGAVRGRSRRRRAVVPAERVVVAADQGARPGVPRVLQGSVQKRKWSGAARSDHRRNRFRRRSPCRALAGIDRARGVGRVPAAIRTPRTRWVAGRRSASIASRATRDRQPSAVADLPSAPVRRTSAECGSTRPGRSRATSCDAHLLRCRSAAQDLPAACSSRDRRRSTRPRTSQSRRKARSPPATRTR